MQVSISNRFLGPPKMGNNLILSLYLDPPNLSPVTNSCGSNIGPHFKNYLLDIYSREKIVST
jgi:hypothetical protein